jgi:hypothetical protein
MSQITRSDPRFITGIARPNSWVSCMGSTEAEAMASSPGARATKPGFAHTAVDPFFLSRLDRQGVDGILISVIRGIQEGHRGGSEANAYPRGHDRCVSKITTSARALTIRMQSVHVRVQSHASPHRLRDQALWCATR